MNPPTFRYVVCCRPKPEAYKTGEALGNYFREFSSTQSPAQYAGPPGSPNNSSSSSNSDRRGGTVHQRGRAASSAINTMVRGQGQSLSGSQGIGRTTYATGVGAGASAGGAKILDVRSLPRGLGRGGNRFAGPVGRGGVRGGLQGGFRGGLRGGLRGGARGGARGRGRGGGQGWRKRRNGEEEDGGARERRKRDEDPLMVRDPAEVAFDEAMRFGSPSTWEAKLDVETIMEHSPIAPGTAAGRRAAIMECLSAMGGGTGDAVGSDSGYLAGTTEGRIEQDGLAFFATMEGRARVEEQVRVWEAEEAEEEAAAASVSKPQSAASFKPRSSAVVSGSRNAAGATDSAAAAIFASDPQMAALLASQAASKPAAAAANTTPVFTTASNTVRRVVFDAAIAGQHEAPRFATDVHGVARSQLLRTQGYDAAALAMFQAKLHKLAGPPLTPKPPTPVIAAAAAAAPTEPADKSLL